MLSTAPYAKLSITMSTLLTRRRKRSRPALEPFDRSIAMLRLFRLKKWKTAAEPAGIERTESPSSRSTLTTSAPRSASSNPADGPAMMCPSSSTRSPSSGSDSGVDVLVHLLRLRERRRERELHALFDLRLHVAQNAVEGVAVDQLLLREPRGERLQRIALRHPVLLFVARAVLAVHVAHVVPVVAIRLGFEE